MYTVSFDSMGGNSIESQTVKYEGCVKIFRGIGHIITKPVKNGAQAFIAVDCAKAFGLHGMKMVRNFMKENMWQEKSSALGNRGTKTKTSTTPAPSTKA